MLFYFAGELTKSKSKISQHAEQVRDIKLFKDWELGNEHSKRGNKHETDHFFLRGMDKIQNKNKTQLTPKREDCLQGPSEEESFELDWW